MIKGPLCFGQNYASQSSNVIVEQWIAADGHVYSGMYVHVLREVMAECLGSWADFGSLWRASGCDELASTHIPIIIHEDAVPHFSGALC